jgi:ADP-ribosyl-[dinitrogen reductase] hydrolase
MVGGGVFGLKPGQWTDDTSMALCLGASLLEAGFDKRDQLTKYLRWYREGYMSSNGRCFDIGGATRSALQHFGRTGEVDAGSTDPRSAGNGCIMRLAPVPIYFANDANDAVSYCEEQSRTTHGAPECLEASRLFGEILVRALRGSDDKRAILLGSEPQQYSAKIRAVAEGSYFEKREDRIRGSGYVVESLEAALWCFWTSDNFREAILRATNLGDDADTTAAITGQIAGADYGATGIPADWVSRVSMSKEILDMAEQLIATR